MIPSQWDKADLSWKVASPLPQTGNSGQEYERCWGESKDSRNANCPTHTGLRHSSFPFCPLFLWSWGKVPLCTLKMQTKHHRKAIRFTDEEINRAVNSSRSQLAWVQFLILYTVGNVHVITPMWCDKIVKGHLQEGTAKATARKQSKKMGRKWTQTLRKKDAVSALRGPLNNTLTTSVLKMLSDTLPYRRESACLPAKGHSTPETERPKKDMDNKIPFEIILL